MAKVLCVLYDDPTDGYPTTYARDDRRPSTTIPAARPPRPPRPSTSRRATSSAASPANSACAPSWRRPATPSSSPLTRTATGRSSTGSRRTRTW